MHDWRKGKKILELKILQKKSLAGRVENFFVWFAVRNVDFSGVLSGTFFLEARHPAPQLVATYAAMTSQVRTRAHSRGPSGTVPLQEIFVSHFLRVKTFGQRGEVS